jgi:hypothetical protein
MTQDEFGDWLWGTGQSDAQRRFNEISRDELIAQRVTVEMAHCWHRFYELAIKRGRGLPTSVARMELLKKCVDLLDLERQES